MKLLFDQNLSRKLVTRLADIFPDSSHVQFHNLTQAEDIEIWEFAKAQDFCFVTQDVDFADRSRLYGSPLLPINYGIEAILQTEKLTAK